MNKYKTGYTTMTKKILDNELAIEIITHSMGHKPDPKLEAINNDVQKFFIDKELGHLAYEIVFDKKRKQKIYGPRSSKIIGLDFLDDFICPEPVCLSAKFAAYQKISRIDAMLKKHGAELRSCNFLIQNYHVSTCNHMMCSSFEESPSNDYIECRVTEQDVTLAWEMYDVHNRKKQQCS